MTNEEMYHSPVKTWYCEMFPDDPIGEDLPATLGEANSPFFAADIEADSSFSEKEISFEDYFLVLDGYGDVYSLMGRAADSIVRERIFQQLAEIMNVDYDYIYEQWLRGVSD